MATRADCADLKHEPSLAPALIAFAIMECLVVAQAAFAYHGHFLTASQMQAGGVSQGLPFVWHFAMWSDLVISALAAYIIWRYSASWRWYWILFTIAIGFGSAAALSWLYMQSNVPEAHVQHHQLTVAGWLHLFYMAIAIAVFTQFLFFTKPVSAWALRLVSVLLFLHVVIGTHMVLGIIKLYYPLTWYPTQPLESLIGWITIGVVGVGLFARNFGLALTLWVINQRYKTAEEYLKLLDRFCGVVNIWYFLGVIGWRWYSGAGVMPIVLIALLGIIYYLSRLSVWQELEIGRSLYPPDRIPDELKLEDRAKITFQVFIFMTAYVLAAWSAHCILAVSLLMLIIAAVDLNTRKQINNNMREYFGNPYYAPPPGERASQAMMERRAIAEWFLFDLPHLWKERARIAGCALAFGIANYAYLSSGHEVSLWGYVVDIVYCGFYGQATSNGASTVAYLVLIAVLVLNELITIRWRITRDRKLRRLP